MTASSARSTIAEQRADRQIARDAAPELGHIDIEHHHDKEKQHRDGADINDDQNEAEKLRAHQHEQARRH